MKIVVCFLAIAAVVGSTEIEDPLASRSISSSIEDAIIDIREQMPCGFSRLGIPPLAPFTIDHQDINIDLPGFSLNGTINNFNFHNLDNFDIVEVKLVIVKNKFTFRFIFKNIYVDTWYSLKLFLKKFGFTINMIGDGHAKFEIKEMEIWGNFKYSVGVISKKLKLKSFAVHTRIGDVESNIDGILGNGSLTEKFNEILEFAVPAIINENENLISQTIESKMLPVVNGRLNEYKLDELLALILGGNGEGEAAKCEPVK